MGALSSRREGEGEGSPPLPKVFIKTDAVLALRAHPIAFQSFKSLWVGALGFGVLASLAVRGEPYVFSWWGIASAFAWIPSVSTCGRRSGRVGVAVPPSLRPVAVPWPIPRPSRPPPPPDTRA